ncbi:hypothetical protein EMIHUDRAFT_106636 [Emiliania huxleyi CCMP1516]|uniref:RING-type domain-containing protein n=2 Tax=Emiliania huxleyi TaxID=2903 RepID=A0A0D3I6S4_EMIH1|nr:hypothetical protein EMIHUDRAFT_106636 [Emiliania huxleyi CCMP1516]EOD06959.1 hypothetical protein EMIHUDRAFT_106636 [Emiliania huxleyi CCMP1516]|eukprot:XP_005759388.1 hypothetical protein EMIHUDRAFT_106636 [Emiliania huxleyi CCMP1516]
MLCGCASLGHKFGFGNTLDQTLLKDCHAKLLQPRATPTAAGAEAIRQAEREGLTLATSSSNSTGYKGVSYRPNERGTKKYKLQVSAGGKVVSLGCFATAEQAALSYARREAGRDTSDLTAPPPPAPSSAAGAEAVRQAGREGLTLATSSSSTGYKGIYYDPKGNGSKKYKLQVRIDGKQVSLGYFATAEEAALFYARREAGRDMVALYPPPPPPPPPPAPSSAAGAEAVRQTKREGLTLATSSSSNSGYKGVAYRPKQGSKKYQLKVWVGGKQLHLGNFATAEEAALARARHLWDTTVRLLEPPPQPPQGAAGPSEASSYEEEEGFDPADTADAVTNSLLSDPPPSASEQRAARWQARAAEQAARADAAAAAAAAQAAAGAAPPCDDEVEVEAEVESDSEEESEMEVEAAAAVAGVSAATAAEEEALECAICFDDLSAHREARLQPRDPNGWGATRCCKSLFHYSCLHTWLNDDSEVETSCGMEPINTACPGCRGFVPKSSSRMLR